MSDSFRLLPGSQHEMAEVEGAFHFRPTVALVVRRRTGPVMAAVWIACVFLPVIGLDIVLPRFLELVIGSISSFELRAAWLSLTLLTVAWMCFRPPPARLPLTVAPDGRIEYRGREIRPAGRVALVRAYRVNGGDEADTYHVECIADDGKAGELPRRLFKNCEPAEIAAVIPWLGKALKADVKDELAVFAPSGYRRQTRRGKRGGEVKERL